MNVRNCKKCGKIFNYIAGLPLCPACREASEAKFQQVKKYIQDNRGATVPEVASECEVDEQQIRQWVREERLVFAEGSVSGIGCEVCGVAITTGRYCDRCKAGMINSFSAAGRRPQQSLNNDAAARRSNENRMRFLNN